MLKHPVNAPCWCGSGIKFKKCHRDRELQTPVPVWEVEKDTTRALKPAKCVVPTSMHSECGDRIINAHTISKSANLKKLAADGHVYGFKPSIQTLIKNKGMLHPEKIGVNKASTFTGFCGYHDKSIFDEIEDQPMVFSDSQCFKLAYRTIGREHYLKTNMNALEPIFRLGDRGMSSVGQFAVQGLADDFFEGVSLGSNDSIFHKDLYDEILLSKDYSSVQKCVLYFERTPSVMSSGGIFPEFDFQGNVLQSLLPGNHRVGAICFNVVATEVGGAVVFTWLNIPQNVVCIAFVESLLRISSSRMTDALIRFFFEYSENTFMAPTWWDALPEKNKKALSVRMMTSADPFQERNARCLTDDGVAYDEWVFSGVSR